MAPPVDPHLLIPSDSNVYLKLQWLHLFISVFNFVAHAQNGQYCAVILFISDTLAFSIISLNDEAHRTHHSL